jgi:ribosomal-protein-alanine N-acetyltransferase
MHRLLSEELVWRYSTIKPSTTEIDTRSRFDEIMELTRKGEPVFRALYLKGSNDYLGEAGILSHSTTHNRVMIGYHLLPEYWGMGYATEIVRGLVLDAFTSKKCHRIEALVMQGNSASMRVLEKAGFNFEGILRDYIWKEDGYRDSYYFSMINENNKNR